MGFNSFGSLFSITTFGESHGPGIGVVIDGCPANIEISLNEIQQELNRRRPGYSAFTTPRKEPDIVEILSGVFAEKTTGAPIALWIKNTNVDSTKYEKIKDLLRPGHANYTYLEKYGIFDYRGGGRSSARETVARVAAGAIAKKIISPMQISAKVIEVCGKTEQEHINNALKNAIEQGDSLGALIEGKIQNVPAGLGEPIYGKVQALLASALFSIPAVKGVEFGEGFSAAKMRGSSHNDAFEKNKQGDIVTSTNHHGGILGGITTKMPIVFRVAFKPTSSIFKKQKTVDTQGNAQIFCLPKGSRHDPCVALRAPPIVEAMGAIVMADLFLISSKDYVCNFQKYIDKNLTRI